MGRQATWQAFASNLLSMFLVLFFEEIGSDPGEDGGEPHTHTPFSPFTPSS